MKQAVILARASTGKQVIYGDTLDGQIESCQNLIKKKNWKKIKIFPLVESGRKAEREYFQEVIDFCIDKKNKVDIIVFSDISRFTRGGSKEYFRVKDILTASGIEIQDILETIKSEINTLEDLGQKYDWSVYSPSEQEEARQAEQAKAEVRIALTRMISAEIKYAMKGYWNRTAPYGYLNHKIDTTNEGKRNILLEHPKEGLFIKKIFELKINGRYSDREITNKINGLGFETRKRCKRDKKTKKIIGYGGERKLTVKHLQELVKRPIYAGIICEKWTHYQPVKAKFEGLISVEDFNQANIGRIKIIINNSVVQIKYGAELMGDKIVKRRSKFNPLYPFKNVLRCPVCGKILKASASTGKLGTKYPAYHCSNGHKLWREPRKEVHKNVYNFIHKLKFVKPFTRLFEEVFLETWKEKRQNAVIDSKKAEEYVAGLLDEQKLVYENIKTTISPIVKKKLEEDYEKLEQDIKQARKNRGEKEKKEIDIKLGIKYAVYFMEHLEVLLIDETNPLRQQQLFGLVFDELPTYNDLLSGTPKLASLFSLNSNPNLSKSELVTPSGVEPEFSG